MISLEPLKTFLEAATQGSFRRAAAARFVTVSAVSQQIRALEEQLGTRLFERFGRRVELTPEGRALAASLQPAFMQIDEALSAVDRGAKSIHGLLRIGAPRALAAYWVRPRLLDLMREHPDLSLRMTFDVPTVLERHLSEGRLDAAILVQSPRLPTLASRVVTEETFVAVAAPALVRKVGAPRTLADFQSMPFAIYDPDLAMHQPWWSTHFGSTSPMPSSVVAEVPSLEELLALARAGRCACVLPTYLVTPAVQARKLVILTPRGGAARRASSSIHLAWRTAALKTARLRALLDALG